MDFDEGFLKRYADECAKAGIEPLPPLDALTLVLMVMLVGEAADTSGRRSDMLH